MTNEPIESADLLLASVPRPFLILNNDVVLNRAGGPGEPRRVLLRLEKGSRVPINIIDTNPLNRTPFRCYIEGWPEFFWLGRNPAIIVQPDGSETAL